MMRNFMMYALLGVGMASAGNAMAIDGREVYERACFACHGTGAANSPKLGDKVAWAPRIAKGMEVLLEHAKNGIPGTAMLPRGSCTACSDEELVAAVEFIVSNSQ